MISFSNKELADLPSAEVGQEIDCPHCGGRHTLYGSEPDDEFGVLLFYKCGYSVYVGGLDGKLVNLGPIHTSSEEREKSFAKRYADFVAESAEWFEKEEDESTHECCYCGRVDGKHADWCVYTRESVRGLV